MESQGLLGHVMGCFESIFATNSSKTKAGSNGTHFEIPKCHTVQVVTKCFPMAQQGIEDGPMLSVGVDKSTKILNFGWVLITDIRRISLDPLKPQATFITFPQLPHLLRLAEVVSRNCENYAGLLGALNLTYICIKCHRFGP